MSKSYFAFAWDIIVNLHVHIFKNKKYIYTHVFFAHANLDLISTMVDTIYMHTNKSRKRRPKLPASKTALYEQILDYLKLSELEDAITSANNNTNSISVDKINEICHQFSDIFSNAAQLCIKNDSNSNPYKGKKVWIGRECQKARKHYHAYKTKHSKYPSLSTRNKLIQASKTYKKNINYFINKHNKLTQDKLRSMKNKSPKEYWNAINNIDNKKQKARSNLTHYIIFSRILTNNLKLKMIPVMRI